MSGPQRSQQLQSVKSAGSSGFPSTSARGKRRDWRVRLAIAAVGVVLCLMNGNVVVSPFAPTANTALTRFDALIVLGAPASRVGNPTPEQMARVNEAVREYERGVAARLIFSGGAVHNQFVEAQVMARTAQAQGIPSSAIFVEPEARDTIQKACYSERIMKVHGWRSAEVISDESHLPRAGIIFSHLPLEWRIHAAPPLSPRFELYGSAATAIETLKTVHYLVWSRWAEHCEP